MKHPGSIFFSIIAAAILISVSIVFFSKEEKTEAQFGGFGVLTPFGGTFGQLEICCNGLKWRQNTVSQEANLADGNFILGWQTFFTGLYMNYSPIQNYCNVGNAYPGGTCITISSECESSDNMDYSVYQVGTGGATCSISAGGGF